MNRRSFLRNMGGAVLGATCASARAETTTASPHIVYILADDLGYGDVGCLNPASKIPTPNIDRLAREGMRFTDAHSASAVCTPTRYGILTGRYCWRSRLKKGVLYGYDRLLIDRKRPTVPSVLKTRGYHTSGIGKWHLGLNWATKENKPAKEGTVDYSKAIDGGPCDVGFDDYFGIPASLDMTPYVYVQNRRVEAIPSETIARSEGVRFWRGGPVAPGFRHEDVLPRLTKKAVERIDQHGARFDEKPLFLYFPLPAPHLPVVPAKEFQGSTAIGPWGDFVHQVDWTVGQVMTALERNGMTENTLLIVTSDNGCTPNGGFHENKKKGHASSHHFRGHKADIYEGGHRVPFIARWPKHIAPESAYAHPICLTDLMATAADLSGYALPNHAGEDSVSLLPALLGKTTEPIREAVVHHSINGSFAIRQGKWKLEFCPGSGGWSEPKPDKARKQKLPPLQLYDLSQDIGERNNLHEKYPEVVEKLRKILEGYIAQGRSTPGSPQKNEGPTSLWGPRGEPA
jgi:arylsulfatase A